MSTLYPGNPKFNPDNWNLIWPSCYVQLINNIGLSRTGDMHVLMNQRQVLVHRRRKTIRCQLNQWSLVVNWAQSSLKFESKCKICIQRCRLHNVGHFVKASVYSRLEKPQGHEELQIHPIERYVPCQQTLLKRSAMDNDNRYENFMKSFNTYTHVVTISKCVQKVLCLDHIWTQTEIVPYHTWPGDSQSESKLVKPDRLTHWGRVTHIFVSDLTIIGSDNGLSPGWRQAIIRTNAGILLIRPLGTNYSEILIKFLIFSFKKMHLKPPSAKRRPICLGLNVLKQHRHVRFGSIKHHNLCIWPGYRNPQL